MSQLAGAMSIFSNTNSLMYLKPRLSLSKEEKIKNTFTQKIIFVTYPYLLGINFVKTSIITFMNSEKKKKKRMSKTP